MNPILCVLRNQNLRPVLVKFQDHTEPEPVYDLIHLAVAVMDEARYRQIVFKIKDKIMVLQSQATEEKKEYLKDPENYKYDDFRIQKLRQIKTYRRTLEELERAKSGENQEVSDFLSNYYQMKTWQHRKRSAKIRFNGKTLIEVRKEIKTFKRQIQSLQYTFYYKKFT
jgi:hypothetical protein